MPVSIVVGGQYGSEGKGKVASCLVRDSKAVAVIRCGGSNSGHTVFDENGRKFVFRQLPTACLQPGVVNLLVAGSYIDVEILLEEINEAGVKPRNLSIDPFAVIISNRHKSSENGLSASIGSTGSGTGAAVMERVARSSQTLFAKDIAELESYIQDTKTIISTLLLQNRRIILEGTQGYGLSLLHSKNYPYVTSRDTTAAAFLSEAGISPLFVDEIVLVIRTFPIRVPGNSGPLVNETSWQEVFDAAGITSDPELTSVTKKVRRIAKFDSEIVKSAIAVNSPTVIVLNHMDYVPINERGEFLYRIEKELELKIDYLGLNGQGLVKANILMNVATGT